uniref:UBX domain protein 4 n=1 Tax=Oryzias latipes TaxID=8090 RepID=A0A3P9LV15_ORYLA
MLWFEGSIPEAISSAKSRGLVFVVVVSGDDEQSAQLMSSWEDEQVSAAASSCCVAIKVPASSETCVQFSQICILPSWLENFCSACRKWAVAMATSL